jgi:hypothetical protein
VSALTRWRDTLGREWMRKDARTVTPGAWSKLMFGDGYAAEYIEELCGPLTPIQERARVRVFSDEARALLRYARAVGAKVDVGCTQGEGTLWPLERAEEIAAALRTLGYTDARAEVIS